jgi:putative nucleotidyltransferase with HDIG domain
MELSLPQTGVLARPDADQLVEFGRERANRPLAGRELLSESLVGGAFLAIAVAMALFLDAETSFSFTALVAVVFAYTVAYHVNFEVGDGYAVPTELVFVAALFVLPATLVPLVVALSFALTRLGEAAVGKAHPSRALHAFADSWYAVGPALVLVLADAETPQWKYWPIFAAALAAQFIVDAAWGTIRSWLASGVTALTQLRVLGWVYSVDAALAPIGLLAAFAAVGRPYVILLVVPLLGLLASFANERRARIDNALELSNAYRGTAMLLGEVIEADDAYTGDHSRGVVELAVAVADELGLDPRRRSRVEFGALLHDVGKISVPKEIINKPGALSDEEWEIMRQHTIEGEKLLKRVGGMLAEVGTIVRSSHEHYNGGGYPDRLAGDAIPIEARIVSCCDAYSAMTTDRSYRAAMPIGEALAEVSHCAGTQFDPKVAAALVKVVTRWNPELSRERGDAALARSAH